MRRLVGEPHDLVLDRRAIARTATGQMSAVDRTLTEIGGDDFVRLLVGRGDTAGDLGDVDPLGQKTKGNRLAVGGLHFQPVPADRSAVEPSRRPRLQSAHLKSGAVEVGGHSGGWLFAMTTGGNPLISAMDDSIQECAGRQDDCGGAEGCTRVGRNADHTFAVHDQALGRAGHHRQIRRLSQFVLHGLAIQTAVDLAAGALNSRAL